MLCSVALLCLTLCNPTDCSPLGSSFHGDFPGQNTEVFCNSLLQWTTFCQNSPLWPIHPGWPYTAWLIVSLRHEHPHLQAGFRKGRGTRDQIANICWIMGKSKRVPEKHILLLYWLCQNLWLCGSPQTVENSSRDGNTRPPDQPSEKSVFRSRSNS